MQGEHVMDDRQTLRDRYGTRIGEIVIHGSRAELHDRYGYLLGWYSSDTNWTHEQYGNMIGRGNLLVTLLPEQHD
jgi:hypothetical protein